ncbi:hypothetical protein [Rhizobium esperanzae]|uniref:hypothetical protein n=1 Tax=Rhizobium esperanzae TaxID=1967781 RepID=UPI000B4CD6D1|nr:hypothetical protein [Rhizobium esperanzae]
MVALTPPQIRGLKLARDGDLYLQQSKKWTHLDATITFAKADRFQERPIKIKFVTTATVGELRTSGLLKTLDPGADPDISPHGITMAGKMWLLKHK